MSEWLPIEKYDKLKKKPANCIFFVKKEINEQRPYASLRHVISNDRHYGRRITTHYMVLQLPEEK